MIIDKRVHPLLGSGVYADVFAVDGRAYKLFKSGPEAPPRQTREGRRRIFQSQTEGYQRIGNHAWLSSHVPTYFGTRTIEDVIDECGNTTKAD
jgi:hypothetical protein